MSPDTMARWLVAFIEAHENGTLPETDLIVLDEIRAHLTVTNPEIRSEEIDQ